MIGLFTIFSDGRERNLTTRRSAKSLCFPAFNRFSKPSPKDPPLKYPWDYPPCKRTHSKNLGCLLIKIDSFINLSFIFHFLGGFLCGALGRWWNRLWLLAHTDDLFYPLFLFGVYTGVGGYFSSIPVCFCYCRRRRRRRRCCF